MYSVEKTAKAICYMLSLILLLVFANTAHAEDSASVRVINISGGGTIDIKVKNISNDQLATGGLITWSNVQAGVTNWKVANQYIEITHNGLPQSWGMQIYTDNKDASANPQYSGTGNPVGLVRTDRTLLTLPMAWRITDSRISGGPAMPTERTGYSGFSDYLWHYMKDKNSIDDPNTSGINEAFVNGQDYITLWNQKGIGWNEGGRSGNPKKAYIYFAAKFTMAGVGSEYKTSMLTIEAFRGISPFPIYLYKDAPATEYPEEPGATMENHFAPSGWYNYDTSHRILTVNPKCTTSPYSGSHCFKMVYNGANGTDGSQWTGIMWLEPETIWQEHPSPTHNGYDLRGARWLILRAKTDSANNGMQLKIGFGNTWDTGKTPVIWRTPALTTSWQRYAIPLSGLDLSSITGGIAIIVAADHEPSPDGCTVYLDDIKFSEVLD